MHNLVKKIQAYFLAGAFTLIPMILSIYILYHIIIWLDNVFPTLTGIDLPFGFGVITILTITLITGMVAKNFIGKKVIKLGNSIIVSVPILNKIFLTFQEIMDVFVNPKRNFLDQVVMVEYPKEDSWCIAFITSRETEEISKALGFPVICVYVPTTPTPTSGFMLYVSESKVRPVNMSPELAIKAIVSAGIVSSAKGESLTNNHVNLAEMVKKWKQSKAMLKGVAIDPRD